MDRKPVAGELSGDEGGDGALAGPAGAVDADEQSPLAGHAVISGSVRRSPEVTGQTSASTAPIRSPAAMTAAGQPLPHCPAMPQDRQVGLAPISYFPANR